MKKFISITLLSLLIAGGEWGFPSSTPIAVKAKPAKNADTSFVMSITTLDFQGQKNQFQSKRTSLAEISREKKSDGVAYSLSGQGGMRIGREDKPAFYKAAPVIVNRSLPGGSLSSEAPGLNSWFAAVNLTMTGLTHKGQHIQSGTWEDSIVFPQGDGFPKTVRAQFWARPLPKPDDRWTLVTVDSGMLSFEALDKKYKNVSVQGRYRGVLVYSPVEDTFLESAAAFTLYHGQDRFRIEQLQYSADAEGKQLLPLPNIGDYLDFAPRKPNSLLPGALPSWCAQATLLFNLLHLGGLSAAEGATNPGPISVAQQELLDLIQHDFSATEKVLGRAAADALLGDWMKLLDTWRELNASGPAKALWELSKTVAKDLVLEALPYNMGMQYQLLEFTRDLSAATMEEIDAAANKLMSYNYRSLKSAPPPPGSDAVDLSKPPDEVKQPKKGNKFVGETLPLLLLGTTAAYYGLWKAGVLPNIFGGGDDCAPKSTCCETSGGAQVVMITVPGNCDCPTNTTPYGEPFTESMWHQYVRNCRCKC